MATVLVPEGHGQQKVRDGGDGLGRQALRTGGTDTRDPGDRIAQVETPLRNLRAGRQGLSGD